VKRSARRLHEDCSVPSAAGCLRKRGRKSERPRERDSGGLWGFSRVPGTRCPLLERLRGVPHSRRMSRAPGREHRHRNTTRSLRPSSWPVRRRAPTYAQQTQPLRRIATRATTAHLKRAHREGGSEPQRRQRPWPRVVEEQAPSARGRFGLASLTLDPPLEIPFVSSTRQRGRADPCGRGRSRTDASATPFPHRECCPTASPATWL
jgi:hypothetical protein